MCVIRLSAVVVCAVWVSGLSRCAFSYCIQSTRRESKCICVCVRLSGVSKAASELLNKHRKDHANQNSPTAYSNSCLDRSLTAGGTAEGTAGGTAGLVSVDASNTAETDSETREKAIKHEYTSEKWTALTYGACLQSLNCLDEDGETPRGVGVSTRQIIHGTLGPEDLKMAREMLNERVSEAHTHIYTRTFEYAHDGTNKVIPLYTRLFHSKSIQVSKYQNI